ncbi:hypothetical protein [Psychrosphaera aestuarii]|uniref:hypothetical protein n=1 Tax=Psychrosphaera aestuarii TaxID=1266052 RepID=UPI001B325847|nr:hypothetical protein [Psychrosphaera aestuarii]
MKFLFKFFLVLVFLVVMVAVALISFKPITLENKVLTPMQVAAAKSSLQRLLTELRSESEVISLVMYQSELDALSDLAAHTINNASFENYVSGSIYTSAISYNLSQLIDFSHKDLYLNAYCSMEQQAEKFIIEHCKLGSILLPHFIAEPLVLGTLKRAMKPKPAQLVQMLFEQIQVKTSSLTLTTERPPLLVQLVKDSFKSLKQQATDIAVGKRFNAKKFYDYVTLLERNKANSEELSYYVGLVFQEARSNLIAQPSLSAASENRHALWALASYFGNSKFAKIAGLNIPPDSKPLQTPVVHGRKDLTLHFLYSAILEQLGGQQIGLNIGEIKELYDANEGGSGYSFPDLAADKAGLSFSQFVVYNEQQARQAQQMLAGIKDESVFFPMVDQLPEGLSATQFKDELGNKHSIEYKLIEQAIDDRIRRLPLYQ